MLIIVHTNLLTRTSYRPKNVFSRNFKACTIYWPPLLSMIGVIIVVGVVIIFISNINLIVINVIVSPQNKAAGLRNCNQIAIKLISCYRFSCTIAFYCILATVILNIDNSLNCQFIKVIHNICCSKPRQFQPLFLHNVCIAYVLWLLCK